MSRPWMPLYVADYLADTGHLNATEHGAYLLLIMHYWQRGSLPNSKTKLASIARVLPEQWDDISDTLAEFFTVGWRHERIEAELEKAENKYQARVNAGKKGGEAKASNARSLLKQNATNHNHISEEEPNGSSKIEPNGSLSETSSDEKPSKAKKRREYPPAFEVVWRDYPTDANMSKAESFDAWKKLDAADKDALAASIGPFRDYCRANPDYRPIHMCRYIAKRRFEGHGGAPKIAGDEFCPEDWVNTRFLVIRFRNERSTDPPRAVQGGKAGYLLPAEWVRTSKQRTAQHG